MTGDGKIRPLFEGSDWNFQLIQEIYEVVEHIAVNALGLDVYPNQIEVITAEQMLDAYSSSGMPLLYKHWSFGKQFLTNELLYRKGMRGLAYELVINSNPCISYIMEENSATMQTLVIAHAAFGHNHFFKNNYLFKQWTDPDGILDYIEFSKNYISLCEERYGQSAVERVLDAAHALMHQGVHRYPRAQPRDLKAEAQREADRHAHQEKTYNELWRTLPKGAPVPVSAPSDTQRRRFDLPQENILYFLEKSAPNLAPWQREILRITRLMAQYFYPQTQTKVMNEGTATYCHYRIMHDLHYSGHITDGSFLEFLQSHTNVIHQPLFDSRNYSGMNPYWLGFNMMQDIERICNVPTEEDRTWFPEFAGNGRAEETLKHIWANYRDESFILQFLSPHLIRSWRLFKIADHEDNDDLQVAAIHNEKGYREIRRTLARQFDIGWQEPDIQIIDVDMAGDRRLILEHYISDNIPLAADDTEEVLQHLANLWGYEVCLREVKREGGGLLREHIVAPERRQS